MHLWKGFLMPLFRSHRTRNSPRHATTGTPVYAFCEPVTATPTSFWHLRLVGPEGIKLGGGIPGPVLCGRDLRNGWDLQSEVTVDSVVTGSQPRPSDGRIFVCPKCAAAYLRTQAETEAQAL